MLFFFFFFFNSSLDIYITACLYRMAQRLDTMIKLTRGFDTKKGQRSNWGKYAENAYKYSHFLSLYKFAILNGTIVNRHKCYTEG